ncbi:helix-turn-helix domain-containing protein [Dongia sedimenti]|uniref:Helix-turn-helix transcriptional regulator n=1 Tax=Dongia sedimenti TaxID=3064282 RepID=A0ABU0YVC9_9PROT|nr:helix-turn-helix transcriptional regulator [Rhodospirillaceae bacterium R-7]
MARTTAYNAAALGSFVRDLREARELSLTALADSAGVAKQALANLEKGDVVPSLVTLAQLAAALRVDLLDLVRAGTVGTRPPRKSLRAIAAILDKLDDQNVEILTEQSRALLTVQNRRKRS